jgi:oxygen-dependent protoporphyrinogen oxidase
VAAGRVAVVGGGITGLAAALELRRLGSDVVLFEESERFGGKIRTTAFAGAAVDEGADAFLARVPEALTLCRDLGLGDELVTPATGRAYIWRRGQLRALPAGLVLGVPSRVRPLVPVVGWAGTARAAVEPLLPSGPNDDCLGRQVRRRFGRAVAEFLVDPLLGGINAGDADALSLAAAAPQLAELAKHRSWLLAARRHLAQNPPSPDRPVFSTVVGGLGVMIDALATRLRNDGVDLRAATPVDTLHRHNGGWDNGGWEIADEHFDAVIVTTPASVSAKLVGHVSADAAAGLASIDEVSVAIVRLAFADRDVSRTLDGSGYLVPKPEQRHVTACSWASTKWAQWKVPGQTILRASVGRWRDSHAYELDDDDLVRAVLSDLDVQMGIRAQPSAADVCRWPGGFPQYHPEHLSTIAAIEAALAADAPGLVTTGAAHRGLGIPACIRQGAAAAVSVTARLRTT